MLIPYATDRPRQRTTVVVYVLIAMNVAVWILTELLRPSMGEARYLDMLGDFWLFEADFNWWGLITYQFMHAGPLHLLGNMLFLYAMGPNVEDRLGRLGFAAFYLVGGAAAGGAHMLFSNAPVVGASGSISAVTGAFLVMFPSCRIRVISFLIFYIGRFEIPAWWFIGFQVAWNLLLPALGFGQNVSFSAHLGGYAFGAGVAFGLLATGVLKHEPYDLYTAFRQAKRRNEIRAAVDESAKRRSRAMHADAAPSLPTEVLHDRTAVNAAIATGTPDKVVEAYRRLAAHDNLPRSARTFQPSTQLELANFLFGANAYEEAAQAYEDLLERTRAGSVAQSARVLLARLCVQFLGEPERARTLLTDALGRGLSPELAEAAREDLDALPEPFPPTATPAGPSPTPASRKQPE